MKVVIRSPFSKFILAPLLLSFFGCGSSTSTEALTDNPTADTSPVSAPIDLVASTPKPTPQTEKSAAQIRYLYNKWKQSWADMHIDTFMSFYSPKTRSGKVGYTGIRERKIRQWQKERFIGITDIGQPKIAVQGNSATLSVLQEYNSTTWWDKGQKTLTWQKIGGRWLITDERFTAYAQKTKVQPTPTPAPANAVELDTPSQFASPDTNSSTDIANTDTSALSNPPLNSPSFGTSNSSDFGSDASSASKPLAQSGGCSSGATAICSDGSVSYSAHRRGTCSHHGGVASWCN